MDAQVSQYLFHDKPWQEFFDFLSKPGQFCLARDGEEKHLCLVIYLGPHQLYVKRIFHHVLYRTVSLEGSHRQFATVGHLLHTCCEQGVYGGFSALTKIKLRQPVYSRVPPLQYLAGVVLKRSQRTFREPEVPFYVPRIVQQSHPYF